MITRPIETVWRWSKIRNLLRNNQPIFYRLYLGEQEILDEHGNSTGIYAPSYSELRSAMLTVSPNKGSSEVEQFGSLEDYDRTMVTSDPHCPIDENAILWVDNADTDKEHNAIVKLVGRWKNSSQYAIKMVKVSYASPASGGGGDDTGG